MRKLIAFLSALTICASFTACKKEGKASENSGSQQSQGQSGGVSQKVEEEPSVEITAFRSESLLTAESGTYVGGVQSLGADRYLVTMSNQSELYQSVTDSNFSSYTTLEPQLPSECENDGINSFEYAPESDGTVYALLSNTTYGGMTAPEVYDESFDYDAYNAAKFTELYLVHYDKDFKIISSLHLDALTDFVNEAENNFMSTLCPLMVWDEKNLLISTSEKELLLIDKETGTETGKIDTSAADFDYMSIIPDRDGKLLCFFNTQEAFEVCEIDKENKKLGESFCIFEDEPRIALLSGAGEYRFFIGKTNGLYGYTDDGKIRLVMDWIESGIDTNRSSVRLACEDGSFIVVANEDSESGLKRFIRKESDEIKEIQKISVSIMDGNYGELSEEITEFNKAFDDYSVVTKSSASYDELKLDIISGNAPDVLYFADNSFIQQVSDKGVFTDLYELMENDPEINRDTVLPNVLKACETNEGILPALPHYFDIKTLIIKTKYWDKPSMTSHELIELYKSKENEMVLLESNNTKREVYSLLTNSGENFVDYEKAECYFDTPEFKEILEFCNTFPEEEEMPDKFTDPEGLDNFYTDRATWLRNDKALVDDIPEFGYLYSYNMRKFGNFGEDVTLVGMPLRENSKPMLGFNFTFSIMNTCENKEAAWEFVKLCLKKEYKSSGSDVIQWHHFNILNDSFDRMAEDAQKKQGINESFLGNDIPPLTQEDCDMLKEFMLTADIVQNNFYDSAVSKICSEETMAYFAGEQTADQTAEYIQSRVSIMLSEQS